MNNNKKNIVNIGKIKAGKTSNFEDKAKEEQSKTKGEILESANIADSANHLLLEEDFTNLENTPYFSNNIYENLPKLLRDSSALIQNNRQRDVYLTSALTVLSGVMGNVKGIYDNRIFTPNLYAFIVAPAGSGKGIIEFGRQLSNSLNEYIQTDSGKSFISDGITGKLKCRNKRLFLPANISSAKLISSLHKIDASVIIFENEADTLGELQKNGWSNFSDILRKSFHHEKISYSRLKDDVEIEVNFPKVSVLLTGTHDQVSKIIPTDENGLFSRFMFYTYEAPSQWNNVTPTSGESLLNKFNTFSSQVLDMYKELEGKDITFDYTDEQWKHINILFAKWHLDINSHVTNKANSTIYRLGLIMFRLSMVLSVIRCNEEKSLNNKIFCKQIDFDNSRLLVETLLKHSLFMLRKMKNTSFGFNAIKLKFLKSLPIDTLFMRKDALSIGVSLGISERSIDYYLKDFIKSGYLFQPSKAGEYIKKK